MDEYVKKKTVLEQLEDIEYREPSYHHAGEMIKAVRDMPAADVCVARRGTWKTAYLDHEAFGERPKVFYCSRCNEVSTFRTHFCPNCGADMRKERDNG